jgi:hypothetical protein
MEKPMRILDSVQECSGLVVLCAFANGDIEWLRASELPLSREEVEKMIPAAEKDLPEWAI